ncbi:hypothetical protein Nepgr_031781 [Nepenthes gracilis]|uniref:ABC1 atypical kinase-like domain-containing protein n=1 Tax=Nepenthes gracilis TaxID=150966 RepID=A0AAD3Y5F0_NEPGR|nr:hypothetical protein Nepgr_031781 [Nepenthes gracilis]
MRLRNFITRFQVTSTISRSLKAYFDSYTALAFSNNKNLSSRLMQPLLYFPRESEWIKENFGKHGNPLNFCDFIQEAKNSERTAKNLENNKRVKAPRVFWVAQTLSEVFASMIFIHGFVHGDPHPGNILVSSSGPQDFILVLLDHGLYRTLDEELRLNFCQSWKALVLMDSNKIQYLGE